MRALSVSEWLLCSRLTVVCCSVAAVARSLLLLLALRRQARTLESTLDSKLTQYSKLASSLSSAAAGSSSRDANLDDLESGGIAGAEDDVEELIGKVRPAAVARSLARASRS